MICRCRITLKHSKISAFTRKGFIYSRWSKGFSVCYSNISVLRSGSGWNHVTMTSLSGSHVYYLLVVAIVSSVPLPFWFYEKRHGNDQWPCVEENAVLGTAAGNADNTPLYNDPISYGNTYILDYVWRRDLDSDV